MFRYTALINKEYTQNRTSRGSDFELMQWRNNQIVSKHYMFGVLYLTVKRCDSLKHGDVCNIKAQSELTLIVILMLIFCAIFA